jgi:hypothetical protein
MFLVIFAALLGSDEVTVGSRTIETSTYYVSAMATFGVIGACYTNMATSTAFQRDDWQLKQIHGTPRFWAWSSWPSPPPSARWPSVRRCRAG